MNVHDIIERYLRENGFDGLYYAGECACSVDDLAPCGNINENCEAGYLLSCDCGEHDWNIGRLG